MATSAAAAAGSLRGMQPSPHRKSYPGEAALFVSLLWLYVGCRTSARALGALQTVLSR